MHFKVETNRALSADCVLHHNDSIANERPEWKWKNDKQIILLQLKIYASLVRDER
jgi:hypothetical protein